MTTRLADEANRTGARRSTSAPKLCKKGSALSNRAISYPLNAIGLSATDRLVEQFSGVLSEATPLRAGSPAEWSRRQTTTSLNVAVKSKDAGHTDWIGNDKPPSWKLGVLGFGSLLTLLAG